MHDMFQELVTIIVPVYNTGETLPGCIASLLGQTHRNLQILLVDDGSSDNSAEICMDFAAKDDRITLLRCGHKGVSAARNAGLAMAEGDFITFVDSDDFISPYLCETMLRGMKEQNVSIAVTADFYYETESELPSEYDRSCQGTAFTIRDVNFEMMDTVSKKMLIKVIGNMYSASVIGHLRFQEDIHFGEDTLFNMEAFLIAEKAVYIKGYFYFYLQRTNSITHSGYTQKTESVIPAYEQIISLYEGFPTVQKIFKAMYACICLSFIRWHFYYPEMPAELYRYILKKYRSLLSPLLSCYMEKKGIGKYPEAAALLIFAAFPRVYAIYFKIRYGENYKYI